MSYQKITNEMRELNDDDRKVIEMFESLSLEEKKQLIVEIIPPQQLMNMLLEIQMERDEEEIKGILKKWDKEWSEVSGSFWDDIDDNDVWRDTDIDLDW